MEYPLLALLRLRVALLRLLPQVHERFHVRPYLIEHRLRIEPNPETHRRDRDQRCQFTRFEVHHWMIAMRRLLERPETNALHHGEEIPRAQNDADRRDDGIASITWHGEHANERQKLADEPIESRQTEARQAEIDEEKGVDRQPPRHAAVVGQHPSVVTLVEHSHQEEKRSSGETVIYHFQNAAADPLGIQCEHPQHAETEVADAAVSNQLFDVSLRQ